jgi:hypothetical protein
LNAIPTRLRLSRSAKAGVHGCAIAKNFGEILVAQACMFDTLIEYAFCGLRSHDESK